MEPERREQNRKLFDNISSLNFYLHKQYLKSNSWNAQAQ